DSVSLFFFLWATHHECAGWYPHELHADAVGEILGWVFFLSLAGDGACQSNDQNEAEETSHGETSFGDGAWIQSQSTKKQIRQPTSLSWRQRDYFRDTLRSTCL